MPAPQFLVVKFRKDMYLLVEGKHAEECFFIIREGTVRISKQVQLKEEEKKSIIGPGNFIGIESAMSQRSQIESAQVVSDEALMLSVQRSQFEDLIKYNSQIAMKIIQQFSRRIRFLNSALSRLSIKSGYKINDDDESLALFRMGDFYQKLSMNQQAHYIFKRYVECYPKGDMVKEAYTKEKTLEKYYKPSYKTGENDFIRFYEEGSLIFAEGEFGRELYIITKGLVKITKILNGNEIIIAVLKQGDIFGEMAIIENKPRSAAAVALEDVTLMVVLKENFMLMSKTNPQIISRLTCILSERIWFSYKQLAIALIRDPIGRAYNYLSLVLEKNNIEPRSGMSYAFDFGLAELMKLVFVPVDQHKEVSTGIIKNGVVTQLGGKLFTSDVEEIFKLGTYYKNKQEREASQYRFKPGY
ncbi:MAG: Crp/Fnr family transcriptional regulator [Spirochaetaceae bacterium]|nr:Crp/Fnr family transcriptional regulator [Spirochaetaceae bacterium]